MKRTAASAIILTILLGAAACSSSDSTTDPTTTTAGASNASTTTTTEEPTTTTIAGGADSAEDAVTSYIEAAALDQWGKVYDGLHPDQRALFPKEKFLTCSDQMPLQIDDVSVVETYDEPSPLPGVSESMPSTAVTVTIKLSTGDEQTLTAHAFEAGGRWWTSINEERVADCSA